MLTFTHTIDCAKQVKQEVETKIIGHALRYVELNIVVVYIRFTGNDRIPEMTESHDACLKNRNVRVLMR